MKVFFYILSYCEGLFLSHQQWSHSSKQLNVTLSPCEAHTSSTLLHLHHRLDLLYHNVITLSSKCILRQFVLVVLMCPIGYISWSVLPCNGLCVLSPSLKERLDITSLKGPLHIKVMNISCQSTGHRIICDLLFRHTLCNLIKR